jgi:hypothetical protein
MANPLKPTGAALRVDNPKYQVDERSSVGVLQEGLLQAESLGQVERVEHYRKLIRLHAGEVLAA